MQISSEEEGRAEICKWCFQGREQIQTRNKILSSESESAALSVPDLWETEIELKQSFNQAEIER